MSSSCIRNEQTGSTASKFVDIKTTILLQARIALDSNPETKKCHDQQSKTHFGQLEPEDVVTKRIKEALGLKSIAREKLSFRHSVQIAIILRQLAL